MPHLACAHVRLGPFCKAVRGVFLRAGGGAAMKSSRPDSTPFRAAPKVACTGPRFDGVVRRTPHREQATDSSNGGLAMVAACGFVESVEPFPPTGLERCSHPRAVAPSDHMSTPRCFAPACRASRMRSAPEAAPPQAEKAGGRPERGRSCRPPSPCSSKRLSHRRTAPGEVRKRRAISLFSTPSAPHNSICARCLRALA